MLRLLAGLGVAGLVLFSSGGVVCQPLALPARGEDVQWPAGVVELDWYDKSARVQLLASLRYGDRLDVYVLVTRGTQGAAEDFALCMKRDPDCSAWLRVSQVDGAPSLKTEGVSRAPIDSSDEGSADLPESVIRVCLRIPAGAVVDSVSLRRDFFVGVHTGSRCGSGMRGCPPLGRVYVDEGPVGVRERVRQR